MSKEKNAVDTNLRARALESLDSIQRLPQHERSALLKTKAAVDRRVLTRNMTAYFEGVLVARDGSFPAFSMQTFTESIADALMSLGQKHGYSTAVLQTLVHELQDRINTKVGV